MVKAITQNESGFTLIEIISVIVLLGILGAFSYQFFTFGISSYVDLASRDKMTDQGRFIVDRMAREIVNALPNSVRVIQNSEPSVKCIEFFPVNIATGYLSIPTIPASDQVRTITFTTPTSAANNFLAAVFTRDECSVYGVKTGGGSCDITGDGNTDAADRAWHPIRSWSAIDAQTTGITLSSAVSYSQESPSKRLYIATSPVAFCLHDDGRLLRYSGYSFSYPHYFFTLNTPPSGGVLMGEKINFEESRFVFHEADHIRNGLVQIYLSINNHDGSEAFQFNHQVSLHNAP